MGEKELEVLPQYDIDVKSTKKARGAVLCDTKQGLYLIKELKFSEKTLPILYSIQEELQEQGYGNVDTLLKNKEDLYHSEAEDGTKYILKRWFCGKESDIHKETDVLKSVDNLAKLHKMLKIEGVLPIRKKESLKEEFLRHNREMKKIRTFARDRVRKGEFELAYLKCFDEMFAWAEGALERLEESKIENDLEQNHHEIVHGDYNYHNILMTPLGIATTNFEHFYQGIQINDLYYFLRKSMEKNQWNTQLGDKMIESYNRVKTITSKELSYIAICMAYPEKFWKAANSYYRSRKSWIPAKSLEKLQMSIKQTEEKQLFLESVLNFKL